ncbi:MAG: ATP-grasp domain-containing protein [Methanobacteriaceae archaeon]|nr:ATP-grasp domain-containing protein [Methanobacteriaceae archaeon]
MKLIFFEFATANGIKDPTIYSEGLAMLKALIDDFQDMEAYYLISSKLNSLNVKNSKTVPKPIIIDDSIWDWLNDNIFKFDACIFIAPEEDDTLYKLTDLIERKGVNIVGSNSKAVEICTNKYKTYKLLRNKVPIIKTNKIYFNQLNNSIELNKLFSSKTKKIIKPADGVSCSSVYIVDSYKQLKRWAPLIDTNLPYFIMQDYIEGVSCSVSLLSDGKNAVSLSLNAQNITINNGFSYRGGYTPLNHRLSKKARNIAERTVESIPGIKGYVGVDLILNDKVHVIEVNSRITTPYIALKDIINFNLGKAIINSLNGELPDEIFLNGISFFEKKGDNLEIFTNRL